MRILARSVQLGLFTIAVAACGASRGPANGPYETRIADGITPTLTAADAVRISRAYLDAQTPELAAPELHAPPHITAVWTMTADDAPTIDGCIPPAEGDRIVWVTKGTGDFLNLRDHPWSKSEPVDAATAGCVDPAPAGTIAIDDATGEILGVYPESALHPHPSR